MGMEGIDSLVGSLARMMSGATPIPTLNHVFYREKTWYNIMLLD